MHTYDCVNYITTVLIIFDWKY